MSHEWSPDPRPRSPRAGEGGAEALVGYSGWREIGRGGDAVVYHAIQDDLDREVAIKVLRVDDEASVRRFTREVRLMLSLGRQHPNIAKVLQVGTSSLGRPCIVMDFYELGSLDRRLAVHGPLSADEVISVGMVIADALAFAHANGVLHRDVKPQNILILPTSYVLADFGIARVIDSAHTSGADRFSYRHASPQVLDGITPAESDDIFSLGATLFHLLDGQPPFTSDSPEPDSALAYIKRVRTTEPRQLLRPDVPAELAAIILRCLHKNPTQRYASAAAVRDALAGLRTRWAGVAYAGSALPTGKAPAQQEIATEAWGGTAAPGLVRNPNDLTSLRLRGSDAYSPEPATMPPPIVGLGLRRGRGLRRRSVIVMAGAVVGALLMFGGWAALNERASSPQLSPMSAPTQEPTVTPAPASNPDLAPQHLRIVIEGETATARWDPSADEPETWGWGVTQDESEQPVLNRTNRPGERTASTRIDPSWDRICFTVVGLRAGEFGGARECVSR
ncbi:serine/threonine-protein kinase [Ammonicoccus fulvus]|uniref:non-specific serine/threonine protein kinase n=1 Tax=Ammonicoccus fulvus TaxID=3138240 RepID=A0ABZ3FNJ4_9ACTN